MLKVSSLFAALFFCAQPGVAGTVLPGGFSELQIADVAAGTAMAIAPDGRIFICEKGGGLRVIQNDVLLATPFMTLTVDQAGERGLIGITLDPNFSTNNYLYVYYTVPGSAGPPVIPVHNRVSRFTANGNVVLAGSELILMDLDNLTTATNHNGGALKFGPDGKLYVAVGENATTSNSQSFANRLGKILRVNSDAANSIPTDNPFYGTATGLNRSIWALGLRNPFTFNFHRVTGRMFINDVGGNGALATEEINDGLAGANYGWPTTEGDFNQASYPNFTRPFHFFNSGAAGAPECAIVGGSFYDPPVAQFPAAYQNRYFYGDYCAGWIRTVNPADAAPVTYTAFATGTGMLVDLAVDRTNGTLIYYRANGQVVRVSYTGSLAPYISQNPSNLTVSVGVPATFCVAAGGSPAPTFQWQRNGTPIGGATGTCYTLPSPVLGDSGAQFRVVVSNASGSVTSTAGVLTVTSNTQPNATILSPTAGTLYSGSQSITYWGSGTDAEDGSLAPGSLSWTMVFHHGTHTHPFLGPLTGTGGSFIIPNSGETATDVWYRLHLTVTDAGGLSRTVTRDILPQLVTFTVQTAPVALSVTVDGSPLPAPQSVLSVNGMLREIGAPSPQGLYSFQNWSDAGAQTHFVTATAGAVYTANFLAATATRSPTPSITQTRSPTPTSSPTPSAALIVDVGFQWSPRFITVTAGTMVTWDWAGTHDVRSDTGLFTSGPAVANGAFSYTFNTVGTYGFYCSLHGGPGLTGMSGIVYVIPPAGSTLTPSPTRSLTQTPTRTNSQSPTFTVTPSRTNSPSPTFSVMPSHTDSPTAVVTLTQTRSVTPTTTETSTRTASVTASVSPTGTMTGTASPVLTATASSTASATQTPGGPSPTFTPTPLYDIWDPVDDSPSGASAVTPPLYPAYAFHGIHYLGYGVDSQDWFSADLVAGETYIAGSVLFASPGTPTLTLQAYDPGMGLVAADSVTDTVLVTFSAAITGTYLFRLSGSGPLSHQFFISQFVVPTPTPTPTLSPAYSPSATQTRTASITASPTHTPPLPGSSATTTPTLSPVYSPSVTQTRTASPSASPTHTPPLPGSSTTITPTLSPAYSPSPTHTGTASITASPTHTPPLPGSSTTITPTLSPVYSSSATQTRTASITASPTHTPPLPGSSATITPTLSPAYSSSPTHTGTASITLSPTRTSTVSLTPTSSPVVTSSHSPTASPIFSATNTPLPPPPTATRSFTPQPTSTRTVTATPTPSPSFSASPTACPACSPTFTQTATLPPPATTPTASPTTTDVPCACTPTVTRSITPTQTPGSVGTNTPSSTVTGTPTLTSTQTITMPPPPTSTPTVTASAIPTGSSTFTSTASRTTTPTYTHSSTGTMTATLSSTRTATQTATATGSATPTGSPTGTMTTSASPTQSSTLTPTPTQSPVVPTLTPSPVPSSTPEEVLPDVLQAQPVPQPASGPSFGFKVKLQGSADRFELRVYSSAYHRVATAYSQGAYRRGWNAARFDTPKLAQGLYFCRIVAYHGERASKPSAAVRLMVVR